jgi:hypothetical protein
VGEGLDAGWQRPRNQHVPIHAFQAHTADRLFDYACRHLRHRQVELPAEGELQRGVTASLGPRQIAAQLTKI